MSAAAATSGVTNGIELMEAIRDGRVEPPLGTDVVTTNLNVTYLRPLPIGAGQARADGSVVHRGGTLVHGEVAQEDADGRLVLRAAGTCRVRAPR